MNEWDKIYSEGRQLNEWPFSDVVSLVKRHIPELSGKQVLELGCGTGPNIPFFMNNGANYNAFERSEKAIEQALKRMRPNWPGKNTNYIFPIDFTNSFSGVTKKFDLIFDRAAVTHNDTESILRCLGLVYDALKPGGLYIGVDWFSNFHSDHNKGVAVDEFTRTDIPSGQFKGVGKVHFATYRQMMYLFTGFEVLEVQNKVVHNINPKVGITGCVGTFNIVVRKHE